MRILIRYGSITRKFMVLETSDRDGSLNLTVRREGVSTSRKRWSTNSAGQEQKIIEFSSPRPKNKRITIHQSGRVNYHENGKTIFVAPLTQVTQAFALYGYRVPALDRLDLHDEEVAGEDAVFDLPHLPEGPVSFSVILGPVDFSPQGRSIKLEYKAEGYSITFLVDPVTIAVPSALDLYFTTFTPERGLFLQQQMSEGQALISYHQALAATKEIVLYAPNGEGVIRMIFSAPMRIAPRYKIELMDPEFHVSDQDVMRDRRSETVMLKFKVRHRKSGQIIRRPIAIKSIELDAEL
ncbi:hypothetical protein DFR41_11352 [Pseudacidovorax intermedius]|uniref:Uncharacterized protein n=1 Tax=Pseudacidovorax intermedius TaxID=433924 RepID=A0A370F621_9BURK|nr:hypothetical protein [Pseudacidovorax intermedius]RDI19070.1 hypothetical protein DFR41_11352 [Pseudacidovorax intermedius]